MKKPAKKLVFNKNQSINDSKPNRANVFDLLNKLDGNQLIQVADSAVNLLGNGLNYLSEKERTTQVLAQCDAAVQTAMIERGKAFDAEKTKRMGIIYTSKENDQRHELSMEREKNSHATKMRILNQLEKGNISMEQLEQLVNMVKETN